MTERGKNHGMAEDTAGPALLGTGEPAPVTVVNPAVNPAVGAAGRAPVLIISDHASAFIPAALAGLGLDEAQRARHIAYDIGIAEVTRDLARRLDASAVLSHFSRLVIDPNRALDDPTSIVCISDGVIIPGNRDLTPADRARRQETFFLPYHQEITARLDDAAARGAPPFLISMHSFTPVLRGRERSCQVGVLWRRDRESAQALIARLRALGVATGDNQPYSARNGHGYSIECHGEGRGLNHVLIEVRQDLIDTHHGAALWAESLATALTEVVAAQARAPQRIA